MSLPQQQQTMMIMVHTRPITKNFISYGSRNGDRRRTERILFELSHSPELGPGSWCNTIHIACNTTSSDKQQNDPTEKEKILEFCVPLVWFACCAPYIGVYVTLLKWILMQNFHTTAFTQYTSPHSQCTILIAFLLLGPWHKRRGYWHHVVVSVCSHNLEPGSLYCRGEAYCLLLLLVYDFVSCMWWWQFGLSSSFQTCWKSLGK